MTAILRKFNRYGVVKPGFLYGAETRANAYGLETRANSLRDEYEEMESDTSRLCREARDRVEQERRRDQER